MSLLDDYKATDTMTSDCDCWYFSHYCNSRFLPYKFEGWGGVGWGGCNHILHSWKCSYEILAKQRKQVHVHVKQIIIENFVDYTKSPRNFIKFQKFWGSCPTGYGTVSPFNRDASLRYHTTGVFICHPPGHIIVTIGQLVV